MMIIMAYFLHELNRSSPKTTNYDEDDKDDDDDYGINMIINIMIN